MSETYKSALIVGAGSGLSASIARAFAKAGMSVALAARSAAKLDEFVQATGAKAVTTTRKVCESTPSGPAQRPAPL